MPGQTEPLEAKPPKSVHDIAIELRETDRRVTCAKVLGPAAEHRIDRRDDTAKVLVAPRPRRQPPHTHTHPRHRPLRRPPLQEIDASPRPFPDRPAQALAQVTAKKVKALVTPREIHQSRLLWMQLVPEPSQHAADPTPGFL